MRRGEHFACTGMYPGSAVLGTHLAHGILAPLAVAQALRIVACALQLFREVREPHKGGHSKLDGGVMQARVVALRAWAWALSCGRRRGLQVQRG